MTPSFIIKGRFSLKPVAHWPVLFVNEVKSSWLRRDRDSIDRVLSQVSWKSCVIHEALAFRRWVPQSRMEMASVVDPRIPKNMSSENEPCLIHLYPWKPSAQTHCKRPGPSDAQDPFSGHISGDREKQSLESKAIYPKSQAPLISEAKQGWASLVLIWEDITGSH